jgi:parallel beta-helix repeat protein
LAQGNNFGIGLVAAADTGNVFEENTIVGNANGIFLVAGVQGNIFRQNLVAGNPPVQLSLDSPSANGYDIKNLASPDANAFVGNTCMTSLNAACPSTGPSFSASPNPIPVTGGAIVGTTTLSWNAPGAQEIEIHIGAPDGKLFAIMGNRGSLTSGAWVADGMTFYLQDVTGGNPLTSDYTLSTLVVHLQRSGGAHLHFPSLPRLWASGGSALILGLALCWVLPARRGLRSSLRAILGIAILLAAAALSAQSAPSGPETAAALDRMVAARKSQQELARYVFDTHGCRSCHTAGQNGKLGFTEKGKQVGQGFEGCISMLTAMNKIAQVPANQRSSTQRQKASLFEEFGCALCHKMTPGRMGLTDVGAKLTSLHLGCVDVEKLVAGGRTRNHCCPN